MKKILDKISFKILPKLATFVKRAVQECFSAVAKRENVTKIKILPMLFA